MVCRINAVAVTRIFATVASMFALASCGGGDTGATTTQYTIGGTVSGLASGASIVLQRGSPVSGVVAAKAKAASTSVVDSITVSANGTFTFPISVADLTTFDTLIASPPAGEACAVTYGGDVVRSDDITNINVFCGPIPSGNFSPVASMTTPRYLHTATPLANGKVLVAGGFHIPQTPGSVEFNLASTELYDPVSDTWTPAGSLATARSAHTATLLPNGKVLVVGGYSWGTGISIASAELYDPVADAWTSAGNMSVARNYFTATLLRDGKVLVVGGMDGAGIINASAELYDPANNSWSPAASLVTARYLHSTTLLANGKVLVSGGREGTPSLASAELYDPATDSWTQTGSLATVRSGHSSNILPSGKVLVAGGDNEFGLISSAELYDPVNETWSSAGNLSIARTGHSSITTLLPTAMVMVTGGYDQTNVYANAEMYDPVSNTWIATGSLVTARSGHTATLMSNGRMLIVGGTVNYADGLADVEIY